MRYVATAFIVLGMVAGVLVAPAVHADPYCGDGMNWDWVHQICQPGNPVPYPVYPQNPTPIYTYPNGSY